MSLSREELKRLAAAQDDLIRHVKRRQAAKDAERAKQSSLDLICIFVGVIAFGTLLAFIPDVEPERFITETPCLESETRTTWVPRHLTGMPGPGPIVSVEEEVCTLRGPTRVLPNPRHAEWEARQKAKEHK